MAITKVIRTIIYTGTEAELRAHLARRVIYANMDLKDRGWKRSGSTLDIEEGDISFVNREGQTVADPGWGQLRLDPGEWHHPSAYPMTETEKEESLAEEEAWKASEE